LRKSEKGRLRKEGTKIHGPEGDKGTGSKERVVREGK
jgi:hypothetical protein